MTWFQALEAAESSALLSAREHLEELRFVLPRSDSENPDRLPIGFVRDVASTTDAFALKEGFLARETAPDEYRTTLRALTRQGQGLESATPTIARTVGAEKRPDRNRFPDQRTWLGLTCAACHTREIHYQGSVIRIDGGPAMADVSTFLQRVVESLHATLADDSKYARFARRVLGPGHQADQATELRRSVTDYAASLASLDLRSRSSVEFGFARLDAFGILTNEIVGTAMGVPENYRPPSAPVSYPFLWDTPEMDWVQWNGSAHNPLARNVGEVLGVFADLRLGQDTRTSANLTNLHRLEESIKMLSPPPWPEQILGKIDRVRATRGQALYHQHKCASCHATSPYPLTRANAHGRELLKTVMVPLREIQTDPAMARNFLERTGRPGIFAAQFNNATDVPVPALLGVAVRRVIQAEFSRLGLPPAEQLAYIDRRGELTPTKEHLAGYKARSLAGIWATAPFLHNGSVPNLMELLRPPAQRAKRFQVGNREFDPTQVGFSTDGGNFQFDATVPGNLNIGHDYGTALTDEERNDLVEYLKTL